MTSNELWRWYCTGAAGVADMLCRFEQNADAELAPLDQIEQLETARRMLTKVLESQAKKRAATT